MKPDSSSYRFKNCGKPEVVAAGKACKAMSWPMPGWKEATLDSSELYAEETIPAFTVCQ